MPRAVAPRIGLPEVVVAQEQEEYQELVATPVHFEGGLQGLLTRWRFSPEEYAQLARGSDLYLLVLTHGLPLQPVQLSVGLPEWAVDLHLTPEQRAEDERVRRNMADRKADARRALNSVKPPSGLPLLEALTAGDLALMPLGRLDELSRDYVTRYNARLGGQYVARVAGVKAGPDGIEIGVVWRRLVDGFHVHRAVGHLRTACGLQGPTAGVPTDQTGDCPRCFASPDHRHPVPGA